MRKTSTKKAKRGHEKPIRKTQEEKMDSLILVTGEFGPGDIEIKNKKSNRTTDRIIESQIDSIWQKIKKTAKLKKQKCYDGTLYRLNKISTPKAATKGLENILKISEPEERERERERERDRASRSKSNRPADSARPACSQERTSFRNQHDQIQNGFGVTIFSLHLYYRN